MFNLMDPFNIDESDSNRLMQDIIFAICLTLFAMVLIMMPYLNDPGKKDNAPPIGQVSVEFHWLDEHDIDIDGWVLGPADEKPVGYSHRADVQFNLVRDDRGFYNDASEENFENILSRGILEGTYYVDAHWFGGRRKDGVELMPIRVIVSVNTGNSTKQILISKFNLVPGQNYNVFVFDLDEFGNLKPGSLYRDDNITLKNTKGLPDDRTEFNVNNYEDEIQRTPDRGGRGR